MGARCWPAHFRGRLGNFRDLAYPDKIIETPSMQFDIRRLPKLGDRTESVMAMARHYGIAAVELNFILNGDIKYRMCCDMEDRAV